MRRLLCAMMWLPGFVACRDEPGAESASRSATAEVGTQTAAPPSSPSPPDGPPPLPPPNALDSLLALAAAPDTLLDRLATREYDYEVRGLLVHGTAEGWLLVVTADSAREWIRASAVDRLYPLDELVVERLNYLTGAWDGVLRSAPELSAPTLGSGRSWRAAPPDEDETEARVIRAERRDGTLWFEVEVLTSTGCEGETPQRRATDGCRPTARSGRRRSGSFRVGVEPEYGFESGGCSCM